MFTQAIKKIILITNVLLLCLSSYAQKSVMSGKLVDKKSGETIIGATIMLFQNGVQKTGGVTDIDGNYAISAPPGTYKVEMSYAGYAKIIMDDQQLKPGNNQVVDVAMEEESISLEAVIVTAQTVKNTDASLISIQRKSISIQDGVSSQQISRTGSSNAADGMKQMTGAVVEGGKFVVMRGLGDRYSLSQLNGITLPSTDPYRNSASLDLIPAQSIENIITVKTFTPDLPGNFSGGLVNVNTKAFPEKLNVYLQLGQEYNTQSSMIHDFRSHTAGKTDWLGFEDGSRDQPSYLLDEANRKLLSSSTYLAARNPDSKNDYVRDIFNRSSKDLSNEFTHSLRGTPLNSSLNFGLGNKSVLFGRDLGYSFGVNYSSTFSHYDNGNVSTFIYNNPYELFGYQDLKETKSTENPQLGALANISYRISKNSQVSFNFIFNNDAEIVNRTQSGSYLGQVSESSSLFNTNTLEFTQRQFSTYQMLGRHVFPSIGNCELEWMASTTRSFQHEPDLRYFAYTKSGEGDEAEYNINNAEFAFPYHFYRNLTDKIYSSKFDISIPFLTKDKLSSSNKIKVGAFYNGTMRNFEEFRYQLNNTGAPPQIGISTFEGDWDKFFDPSNFGIIGTQSDVNGNVTRYLTGYHYINQVNSRNFYSGSEHIFAAYGMVVYDLTEKIKVIGGVRLEKTMLDVESQDSIVAKGNIDLTDVLYSGNLIYSLTDKSNIRVAVTQTLARPNMRELAPFEQFDTKNGFFNVGNPSLKRTLIKNFDLRYEFYPRLGELISLSAFAKTFENPIIRAFNPRATIPELGFVNIDKAMVYGIELEVRKNLDFIGQFFKNFYVSSNFAVIHSSYKIPTEEFENSKRLFSEYNTNTRPFQGQAPYIANVILSYIDGEKGWESTLAYNVSGEKLYNIALFATPDVYEQEFPALNFKLTKKFADHYQVSFAARNLLNSISKRTQQFQGKEYIAESYSLGTGFGISVAYFIK